METKMQIATLRAKIKELAAGQTLLKRARKTSIPQSERSAIREQLGLKVVLDPYYAANEAWRRSLLITACLNLYNELRQEPYRHGIPKGWEWTYKKQLEELSQDMAHNS